MVAGITLYKNDRSIFRVVKLVCRKELSPAQKLGFIVRQGLIDYPDSGFRDVDLSGAEFNEGDSLSFVDFSGANLTGADFFATDLVGANFEGANLRGADLSYADVRFANFRGADLSGADLLGADRRRADFCGANLTNAEMRDVVYGN